MIILLLTACSNEADRLNEIPKVKSITIQEMISFKEAKRNSAKKISNEVEVTSIVDTFSRASQRPGIVDMADPQYKIKIGKEKFYLWFNEDGASATIMNLKDTHTVFSMSSTEGIYQIIHVDGN